MHASANLERWMTAKTDFETLVNDDVQVEQRHAHTIEATIFAIRLPAVDGRA